MAEMISLHLGRTFAGGCANGSRGHQEVPSGSPASGDMAQAIAVGQSKKLHETDLKRILAELDSMAEDEARRLVQTDARRTKSKE